WFDKHTRIKLIGFSININKCSRKMRFQQRRAKHGHCGKKLINKAILGIANRERIKSGRTKKRIGIGTTAMRRIKNKRNSLLCWRIDLERKNQRKITLQTHASASR